MKAHPYNKNKTLLVSCSKKKISEIKQERSEELEKWKQKENDDK